MLSGFRQKFLFAKAEFMKGREDRSRKVGVVDIRSKASGPACGAAGEH